MTEGRRSSFKDKGRDKERSLEERRRLSESLLRRQRGAALNARRKLKLIDMREDAAESTAPILFNEDEMKAAVRNAVEGLRSPVTDRLRRVRYLRFLLTDSEDPPFQLLRELDTVSVLLTELHTGDPEIRSEVMWALAFLADVDLVSAQQLLPHARQFLIYLSGEHGFDLAELAAWILRSLASISTDEMDVDVATPLSRLVFVCASPELLIDPHAMDAAMTAAWSLCSWITHSCLTRQTLLTCPEFSTRLSGLLSLKNVRILTEASWLITYLVALDDKHLAALITANVVEQLSKVLKLALEEHHPDLNVVHGLLTPVLRSLGNIAAGISPELVREMILHENASVLSCMSECLRCDHRGIQKEACKTLSNVAAACDRSIIEALVSSPVMEHVLRFVSQSAFDIKREAAFVLANICFNNNVPNVEFLKFVLNKPYPIVPGIVSLMKGVDVEAAKLGLDFTQLILENIEDGPQRVEEADGIDALDSLQFRDVPSDLQDLASYLVDTYFGEDYGLDPM